jgi:hypothetical protein
MCWGLARGVLKRVARVSEVLAGETELDNGSRCPRPRREAFGLPYQDSVAKSNGFQARRRVGGFPGRVVRRGVPVEGVRPSLLVEHFFLTTIGREGELLYKNRPEVHA